MWNPTPRATAGARVATSVAACLGLLGLVLIGRGDLFGLDPDGPEAFALMVAELNRLTTGNYAATYFPRLLVSDPLLNGRRRSFAASGTMALRMAISDWRELARANMRLATFAHAVRSTSMAITISAKRLIARRL